MCVLSVCQGTFFAYASSSHSMSMLGFSSIYMFVIVCTLVHYLYQFISFLQLLQLFVCDVIHLISTSLSILSVYDIVQVSTGVHMMVASLCYTGNGPSEHPSI